ncbi:MAG: hypothetical protein WCP06_11095 [Verrucomicrobiota bacterium]
MRFPFPSALRLRVSSGLFLIAAALFATSAAQGQQGQSLLENGDFKNPSDPFKGWVTDYAWTQNQYYVENKNHLTVGNDGGRKCVNFSNAGDGGVKLESSPFLFERGFKYVCKLDIKGGPYRIYFAGYQFIPGIRPHDNPGLQELRMVYQSKATASESGGWTQARMELPGVVLSGDAKAHLKKVRYLTAYIWFQTSGSVTNVTITKVADPAMNF